MTVADFAKTSERFRMKSVSAQVSVHDRLTAFKEALDDLDHVQRPGEITGRPAPQAQPIEQSSERRQGSTGTS